MTSTDHAASNGQAVRTNQPKWAWTVCLAAIAVLTAALVPLWFTTTDCSDDAPCTIGRGQRAGHDAAFHAVTTRAVARALEAGSGTPLLPLVGPRYPEWVDSIQGGLGGPVFSIYPPLATFVAATIEWGLGLDTTVALRSASTIAVILAFCSFFGASRWLGLATAPALLAAALYAGGPHLLTDLHVRSAFATLWAYLWTPWIAAGSWLTLRRDDSRAWWAWWVATGSTAALWCTHVVSGVLLAAAAAPALVALVLHTLRDRISTRQPSVRGVSSDEDRRAATWRGLFRWFAAIALSLPLAAVFLLPMVIARGSVDLEWIQLSDHGDFRRNFLFLDEAAAGFSQAAIKPWMERLALAQLGGGLALTALLAMRWGRQGRDANRRILALVAGGSMVWIFFLQTPWSVPFWNLTPLAWVQFPWRFAGVQGTLLCLLVALALTATERGSAQREKTPSRSSGQLSVEAATGVLVTVLVLVLGFWSVRPFEITLRGGAAEIDRRAPEFWVPEYLPRDWGNNRSPAPGQRFPWTLASGDVVVEQASPGSWQLRLDAPRSSTFIGPLAFPGFRAKLDGKPVHTFTGEDLRLALEVPPGTHELELSYRTPWRRTGFLISVLTLLALLPLSRRIASTSDPRP